MNIAVFADIHGRLMLCFKVCARWERETGETIDYVLQAGDLGCYPSLDRLDRATIKHAKKDPTELGFLNDFASYQEAVADELGETKFPLLFVRGNHEDHMWLDELEQQSAQSSFPVDAYQRVFCLKTGIPHQLVKDDETLTMLGIGRIAPLPGEQDIHQSKYIQPYEVERLYEMDVEQIDVLLTHDAPQDFVRDGYGLEEATLILDSFQPIYHFHGHTEEPYINRQYKDTAVIKLSDLHWQSPDPLETLEVGGMGILRWNNRDEHSFEVVDADWLNDYTFGHWQKIR